MSEKLPEVVFVLGPPGAGKGTQCLKLSEEFSACHLSAGELLRSEIINDGPDGQLIKSIISKGNIVPSTITVGLIARAMKNCMENKFLIDGFPRNMENIEAWDKVIGDKANVKFMLFLDCEDDICVDRILKRNEGRCDDTPDVIRHRIKVYKESTLEVIERYRQEAMLKVVNATQNIDDVYKDSKAYFQQR